METIHYDKLNEHIANELLKIKDLTKLCEKDLDYIVQKYKEITNIKTPAIHK